LKSIENFSRAVAIAPNYTMAHVGLADAYQRIATNGFMSTAEVYPKAIAAVNRALQLEPDLNEAHLALARIKFNLEWDWKVIYFRGFNWI
jgi:Tfp pilus assembly protein PilF